MTYQIETIVDEQNKRWTVVTGEGRTVFIAPRPGHTEVARRKCEQWIEGQKYTLDYYRAAAEKNDDLQRWIEEQKDYRVRLANPSRMYSRSR